MVFAVTYGLGSAAFATLLVLILLGRRAEGAGTRVVLACGLTLFWTSAAAFSGWRSAGLAQALESLRSIGWLYFLGSLLVSARQVRESGRRDYLRLIPLIIGAVALINDLRFVTAGTGPQDLVFTQVVSRVAVAVTGILLVENLYRNTRAELRWHVVPLCIGIGGLFAYDLFLYSDALLFRRVDVMLLAARGATTALIVPPLILTLVRNRDWRIDVHVSREVVFYSATLLASGVFLLSAAAVALVLRRIPGDWGPLFQAVFLSGSVLVLVTVLSSGSFRSRVKGLVARNLFSHRYDYRREWMNFVDTVSGADSSDGLQLRVIRSIANIMDSPGGVLWLRNGTGSFVPSQAWNMHFDRTHYEPEQSSFILAFKDGSVVQEFTGTQTAASNPVVLPGWLKGGPAVWLAVPLQHRAGLLGFIALAPPRAPATLNWESRDLLIAVGKQAAGYLSEEQVTRDLLDAKLLTEYSRRFAFVVHDIKNLVSQLKMTIANARAHGANPEFREDMLHTLENSVARMRDLLSKLRPENITPQELALNNPNDLIASVVQEVGYERVTLTTEDTVGAAPVAIKPGALRSALTHLITNSLEATPDGSRVTVRSKIAGDHLVIEVQDNGPGMDEKFIREELFRPFRSTKSDGYGIGAFQTREIIRDAGGDLQVVSSPGAGTTMRILLPCVPERHSDARRVSAVNS